MAIKYICFTDKGELLAQEIASKIGGSASRCGRGGVSLGGWTEQGFALADALVYVGAVGIAVRAVAPHCRSKATDPAVVVVDECAHFAVPILSGHLGGANDLARAIAAACGAVPVISTATDANGVFAVDEWARRNGCVVIEPQRIKRVSGELLAGKTVRCFSAWPIQGVPPAGVELLAAAGADTDFCLDVHTGDTKSLHIVPRIGVLGIGCKRGVSALQLEQAFCEFVSEAGVWPQCVYAAASIDIKKDEKGLARFCQNHGWPLQFYSAEQLRLVQGSFTASDFVRGVTGVDNVCERAAVLASGGRLCVPKRASSGVTFALALGAFEPSWRWQA